MMVKKAKCAGEIIQFASMWNMEGIVVIGFCQQDYMQLRSHMRIPFVVYDGVCKTTQRIVNISIDNFDGGYQMGCHFRALGHGSALCIADNEVGIDRERMEGFCCGFAPGRAERLLVPMHREARWLFYGHCLDRLREMSAVFAVSDYYAIDLICFLREQGVSVPEDVSVAGFDDTPMCEMVHPALTTVRQDGAQRRPDEVCYVHRHRRHLVLWCPPGSGERPCPKAARSLGVFYPFTGGMRSFQCVPCCFLQEKVDEQTESRLLRPMASLCYPFRYLLRL